MKKSIIVLLLGISITLSSNPVLARQDKPVKNTAQAAERAKLQVKGRVLKVDKKSDRYRVKVLKKSGRVVSVDVDSRSGKVQPSKQEDKRKR